MPSEKPPEKIPKTIRMRPESEVIAQLKKSIGNVSHAARALGMSRAKLAERIARHPELREIVNDARQTMVDDAENALHASVINKEGWAVTFVLKTLGRDRGYVEKQEVEHSGEIAMPVLNVILTSTTSNGND